MVHVVVSVTVFQQTRQWLQDGVFEAIVYDLRALLPLASGYEAAAVKRFMDRSLAYAKVLNEHTRENLLGP